MTKLITRNHEMDEMDDIMKITKSLEESGLLIKGFTEIIKNKAIELKGEFLGMLFGALSATLQGNLLTGKGVIQTG